MSYPPHVTSDSTGGTAASVSPAVRRTTFVRWLVAGMVLVNLFVTGLVAFVLLAERAREVADAEVLAGNLSKVLEENLTGFAGKIDMILLAVGDEVMRQIADGGIDKAALEAVLARNDARLPESSGLRVVDADGVIRYAVTDVVVSQASIADRPQFKTLRDNPHPGLVISKPVFGRAAKQWIITLSRRIDNPDGSFAGDVHVAVTLGRFTELFASARHGASGSVGLWDATPSMLARFPESGGPEGVITQDPHPSRQLRDLVAGGQVSGLYHTRSGVDNIERVFSFRKVGALPLYLVVGIADEDYLAEWQRTAVRMSGLLILFMVATALASWLAYRGWRRHSQYAAALEATMAVAEQAHRRSDLILDAAGEGICGVDLGGKVTFINPAARRMLGWEADEGIGWCLHEVAHHHRADGTPNLLADCPVMLTLADGRPRHVSDDVHWRKDGTAFPVEFTVTPIGQGAELVGAVTVVRDITQRLWAESRMAHNLALNAALGTILRRSLEDVPLVEVLDEALTELLALPGLDLEKRGCIFIRDRNDGALRMVVAHHLSAQNMAACASVALGACLCGRAAATGEVVFSGCVDHHHAVSYDGMDGHGHYCVPIMSGDDCLGVINVYVTEGHSRDEDEERLLAMFADTLAGVITRKRIEETLRDSEELAKTLMNATIDAAFLMDRDGIVLAANEAMASRFGMRPPDLIGRSFLEMLPPSLAESRRSEIARVLAKGEPLHIHDERDGAVLDSRVYPVRDAAGTVVQVAVFSRDVTEQRRSQETIERALTDLAHSNEELQQFAYVASHDLREPLRTITSHLQLLHRRLGKDGLDPAGEESLAFVLDGAKRMDALIRDLLEYSRIGHGDRAMEPVDLGGAVHDALTNLSVAIAESKAAVSLPDQWPSVIGNATELARLFQNVLGNALKYRAEDRAPAIAVRVTRGDGVWDVSVQDNGIGIDAEHFDRIFMIFQRLHGRRQYEGTGIGLAICKKIVERHGGHIWLDSKPGEGSTFHLVFPVPAGNHRVGR